MEVAICKRKQVGTHDWRSLELNRLKAARSFARFFGHIAECYLVLEQLCWKSNVAFCLWLVNTRKCFASVVAFELVAIMTSPFCGRTRVNTVHGLCYLPEK